MDADHDPDDAATVGLEALPMARRTGGVRAVRELVRVLGKAEPWLRLRVGDYRVLYRPAGEGGYAVERIVHRRDLDRAVNSLPAIG